MDSLQINTGVIKIPITRDDEAVGDFIFNPNDSVTRERFFLLFKNLDEKKIELEHKDQEIRRDKTLSKTEMIEKLNHLDIESANMIREQIDLLFGENTSQKVFGDYRVLRVPKGVRTPFEQFIYSVLPYFNAATKSKIEKYTNKRPKRVKK